jgi:hypothetical protein
MHHAAPRARSRPSPHTRPRPGAPALLLALLAALALLPACAPHARDTTSATHAAPGAPSLAPRTLEAERDALLLAMLDEQALYTLASDLKPMSSGGWNARVALDAPDLAGLERTRLLLAPFREGDEFGADFYADIQVFATPHEGRRSVEAYVINRRALRDMIARYPEFWAPLAITPTTHPAEVLATVERLPRLERFRGYGYLYGYPRYAVDFFVQAAEEQQRLGQREPIPRDFRQVPTYSAQSGQFVYAVAKGEPVRAEDEEILRRAGAVLEEYRKRRAHWVRDDGRGAMDLLRRWRRESRARGE